MAHPPRGNAVGQTAQSTNAAKPANGLFTPTPSEPTGASGVNRKKQKRRQKEAAKKQVEYEEAMKERVAAARANGNFQSAGYPDPDAYDDDDDDQYFSEDEDAYNDRYDPSYPNGHQHAQAGAVEGRKKSKKKKKGKANAPDPYRPHGRMYSHDPHTHAPPPPPPPPPQSMSSAALRTVQRNTKADRIWNTSTQEERERIKEFWLSLGEDERKSLVKIEKEAVLRKMKEQQKHSCSCTVCGRKRTAIEEELEVLYDAYYEELEQYGNRVPPLANGVPTFPVPRLDNQLLSRLPPDRMPPPLLHPPQPSRGHIEEIPDDEDEEEDEEEFSDSEDYDEDEFESDEEPEELPRHASDFFNFGNSLTVKGGILTVADDLLKNDGKKFIEMMEQLAERRMQREEEAQYAAAAHPTSYQDGYRHNHGPVPEEEEYDDEDDEDYDSQEEEYDEEEEDMDTMTEEQRMQEGRRMFQIFAARMFEQRVLTAYREKVARERQEKLLEELDEEKTVDAAREAKKQRDAEKKKQKKQAQKQKLAEEKARKDAEKAAEEAAVKEAELKKQEELRKRKEEQRVKKEEQRKAQEAEIARKNAEKLKRQKEEQDRRLETERKAREQKEAEKKAKEEAKRKEREEREGREREARERKAKAEKDRKDREAKDKAERETAERTKRESQATQQANAVQQAAQAAKRAVAPGPIPIPLGLQKHPSGFSPHVQVATPALPKAPTPSRPRQSSQQGSKGSSPKASQAADGQAKAGSPPAMPNSGQQTQTAPKTILSRPPSQPAVAAAHLPHQAPLHGAPPPGMPMPHGAPLFALPNMNGFPQNQGPMMPQRTMGQSMPGMFSPQAPIGNHFRPFPNGLPGPPPGMGAPGMGPIGRGFPDVPPGFPQQMPGAHAFGGPGREAIPSHSAVPQQHSRQQSGSSVAEQSLASQPIARPAPIGRPSSVKPQDGRGEFDIDDLSKHLGSSALLADDDPPEQSFLDRRPSMAPGGAPGLTRGASNLSTGFAPPLFTGNQTFGTPSTTWGSPSMGPFGQSGLPNGSGGGWGPSPTSTWPMASSALPFGNSAPMGGAPPIASRPRPHQIRINMCNACKSLTKSGLPGSAEGFHPAATVLASIQLSVQPPISEDELEMMLTTEGTAQNGGGSFQSKRVGDGQLDMLIKWSDGGENAGLRGLGEIGGGIGSPIVGAREPGSVGGTPFGSMRGFPGMGIPGLGSSGL